VTTWTRYRARRKWLSFMTRRRLLRGYCLGAACGGADFLSQQSARSYLIDRFDRLIQVEYRDEIYLVRDNGAVCRKHRPGRRTTKLDDVWTFGRPDNSNGYMLIGSHVVHCVVAYTFHGERPSTKHVVDHIDTNRRNNRADNLRWVTRLENLILNPITLKRILSRYGSLDEFFKNPGALRIQGSNFDWMRTVTKEEAEESRNRLLEWAESDQIPKGGQLGEWVFRSLRSNEPILEDNADRQSATPTTVQRNWKTYTEFPNCPVLIGSDPLSEHAAKLKEGTVFSRNVFGAAVTVSAKQNDALVGVLCNLPDNSIKKWAVSKITVEDQRFIHESVSTYFSREGALKAYYKLVDLPHDDVECIDDFC
jgi:hypothetical protein